MKTIKLQKGILILAILAFVYHADAQLKKTHFHFPDAGGYKVLKADFHLHTVFSDGSVWPVTRVEEAYAEDLDVITLTEHIEYRPHLTDMSTTDHNRSYDLAKSAAERHGILLIRSTEITRGMPPGHLNIIDIQDANAFEKYVNRDNTSDTTHVTQALAEGKRQGGFIFWNHTAYPTPDDKSTWHPAHQRLVQEGLMMGIEVVNGERYESIAFQWCLDHNLTILSNTDVHSTMAQKREADGFKVMTLVLAKEKSQEAVMDALRNRRTVALWNNRLMGRREHVTPVVQGAIKAVLYGGENQMLFEITNESGFPFTFQLSALPDGFRVRNIPVTLNPHETVALSVRGETIPANINMKMFNVWTTPTENPEIAIPVTYIKK